MLVRSAPWTVQLYGIPTQRIYINIKKMNEVEKKKRIKYKIKCAKKIRLQDSIL